MNMFKRREKKLGSAQGKRRYDLPLNKDAGTGFLVLLISLMTFLAALALSSSFAMSSMTERWTTGLENRATIEIPPETETGEIMDRADVMELTEAVAYNLGDHPGVIEARALSESEITDLVEPWLGSDLMSQGIPIPGMISLQLSDSTPESLQALAYKVETLAPQARIDTHKSWLNDILRIADTLKLASILLITVIGITMLAAVGGAIRSRMAVHKEEVELLHYMGATDAYISRQFQRHSRVLALKGAIFGILATGITLVIFSWVTGSTTGGLVPEFSITFHQILMIASLPLFIAFLASYTASRTVRRELELLP